MSNSNSVKNHSIIVLENDLCQVFRLDDFGFGVFMTTTIWFSSLLGTKRKCASVKVGSVFEGRSYGLAGSVVADSVGVTFVNYRHVLSPSGALTTCGTGWRSGHIPMI